MSRISICCRYVIDVTVLDLLSLRELGDWDSVSLASFVLLDVLG